jgi:hypothetical protein
MLTPGGKCLPVLAGSQIRQARAGRAGSNSGRPAAGIIGEKWSACKEKECMQGKSELLTLAEHQQSEEFGVVVWRRDKRTWRVGGNELSSLLVTVDQVVRRAGFRAVAGDC